MNSDKKVKICIDSLNYYDNEDIQVHDAFNDSEVTAKVFEAFKEDILYGTKTQEIKGNFD